VCMNPSGKDRKQGQMIGNRRGGQTISLELLLPGNDITVKIGRGMNMSADIFEKRMKPLQVQIDFTRNLLRTDSNDSNLEIAGQPD
jgi:hypothetical protein